MRFISKKNSRQGFTLIELLLVVGIIGILASIVIVAVNPGKQFASVLDAKRLSAVNEVQKAMYQYLIDTGSYPSASLLGEGSVNAKPICKAGVPSGTSSCVSLDPLITTYIGEIPADEVETDPAVTGYEVYLEVGRPVITAIHLGTDADTSPASAASSSLVSVAVSSSAPSSSAAPSSSSAPVSSSAASSSVASSSSAISGLVARWTFEEGTGASAADVSGNGYNATLVNSPTWSTTVPATNFTNTRAMSFDGINDYVSAPDIDVTHMTLSAWVKANAGTSGFVMTKGYNGSVLPYSLNIGGNASPYQLDGVGFFPGYAWISSGIIATSIRGDGLYHHIAGTYDGVSLKYYVDGVLKNTSAQGYWNMPQNNNTVDIGAYRTDGAYFSGLIDDVRIYDRALTLAEIGVLAAGN